MIKIGNYIKIKSKYCRKSWYDEDSYRVVGIESCNVGRILTLDRNLKKFINDGADGKNIFEHFVEFDIAKTREEKIKQVLND